MSLEDSNWKRAEENMDDFLKRSKNVEAETHRALENLKPKGNSFEKIPAKSLDGIGQGYVEVQRRRVAEDAVNHALNNMEEVVDHSQPRHPELLEQHIRNTEAFLADIKSQSESNGFPRLRWETFPGEEG